MQHQCCTVVISANCYLPLAAEYLEGIQFHCIFANKSQMTLRKTAVFSCLYPLISSAEQDPISMGNGSNELRHCQRSKFKLPTACWKAKVIQHPPAYTTSVALIRGDGRAQDRWELFAVFRTFYEAACDSESVGAETST